MSYKPNPPLKHGSRIAICYPSSAPPPDRLAAGEAILAGWGLHPIHFHPRGEPLGYLAADDHVRSAALSSSLAAEAEAVWAARGGYGLLRLLETLHLPARRSPPLLIGFSDFSLLLLAGLQADWPALHGPNVTTLSQLAPESLEMLRLCLLEGTMPRYPQLEPLAPGTAGGPLVATNLTMLAATAGTPFFPRLAGAILCLEETNESPYRVDRLFEQLRLTGLFQRIAGLVLGDFDKALDDPLLRYRIATIARQNRIPCCSNLPIGHHDHNWPVPLGHMAHLDAHRGRLEFRT